MKTGSIIFVAYQMVNHMKTDNIIEVIEQTQGYEAEVTTLNTKLKNPDKNETTIINFFKHKIKQPDFKIFINFLFGVESDWNKLEILSLLLISNIDIFTHWYKDALVSCIKSDNKTVSAKAESIYNLYAKDFDIL